MGTPAGVSGDGIDLNEVDALTVADEWFTFFLKPDDNECEGSRRRTDLLGF